MSIYDKSSLVLIPSGTKTGKVFSQKPVSGDGDFTFTRASAATRVNADGNIEKETSNSVLQSNTFSSATWIKQQSGGTTPVVTSGFTDPNGGSNAWRLQCSISGGLYSMISQGLSTTGLNCNSIWIKSNTGSNQDVYFRINNSDQTTTRTATTTWQRIEVFTNAVGQSFTIGVRSAATGATSSCDVLIYAAQTNQGLIAQEVITTTTTALYGGITDNTPRLDYTDSSCPALLLEPQRTNVLEYSEYFDSSYYTKASGTSLDFGYLAPDGTNSAYKLSGNTASIYAPSVIDSSYSRSIWARTTSGTGTAQLLSYFGNTNNIFNITEEWQRFEVSSLTVSTGDLNFYAADLRGVSTLDEIIIWGAQAENASYPTSYIPTYGTSVTRNADFSEATFSDNSLAPTNNSTLYFEVELTGQFKESPNQGGFNLKNSAGTLNRLNFNYGYNRVYSNWVTGSTSQIIAPNTLEIGDTLKVAFQLKESGKLFINGAFKSATQIDWSTYTIGNPEFSYGHKVKNYMLFNSVLTDQELIDLTTI